MSAETIQKIDQAIREHLAERNDDKVLIDWIVGYAAMSPDSGFLHTYAVAEASTPASSLGLMHLALGQLTEDLTGGDDE